LIIAGPVVVVVVVAAVVVLVVVVVVVAAVQAVQALSHGNASWFAARGHAQRAAVGSNALAAADRRGNRQPEETHRGAAGCEGGAEAGEAISLSQLLKCDYGSFGSVYRCHCTIARVSCKFCSFGSYCRTQQQRALARAKEN
jgi:hypothetical protein